MKAIYDYCVGEKVFYGVLKNGKLDIGETTIKKIFANNHRPRKFLEVDIKGKTMSFDLYDNAKTTMFPSHGGGYCNHICIAVSEEHVKKMMLRVAELDARDIEYEVLSKQKKLDTLKKTQNKYHNLIEKLKNVNY